ncbi:Uncharacterized protein BP5553_06556 [Venustampulla echinocandica]|uniref:SMODS and SLOG-associating 2TM effector domain-containing protein n=1 Tax=Venustampulla echinocandica TaxID=2656787 RepID=A0A370TKA1_9HELO|nr:Uncharacterized protein BP5553_06556 [Venustampulla echinocandica]RDL35944.1 Uncharacterized protein BP5553_06556 [Venustampulla echinocandica]
MASAKQPAPSQLSGARPPPVHASTSSSIIHSTEKRFIDEKHIPHPDAKFPDHIAVNIHPSQSEINFPHEGDIPPNGDNPLQTFHAALGIPRPRLIKLKPRRNLLGRKKPPPPHEEKPKQPKLTPANKGVYRQVLSNERRSRFRYSFCDGLLTGAIFLQILVGASVTAFGAGSVSHILITVFGAANTALASLLAVMKSQGLPNRLRQDWNGWRELREHIEEKEREIDMLMQGHAEGAANLDVWAAVREVEARYKTMRLTLEANRPDTYIQVPPSISLPR